MGAGGARAVAAPGRRAVLDAGCGTGQVTEALRERLPDGHVVALDASPSMVDRARARLGADRMTYLAHDLLDPIPIGPVDAILSTATFHWIADHDRLFANLAAVLRPDGPLAAQCGGWAISAGERAAERAAGIDLMATKVYPTPEETWTRLEARGLHRHRVLAARRTPVELPAGELEPYLRTVILSGEVARRSPEEADRLRARGRDRTRRALDRLRAADIVARMG